MYSPKELVNDCISLIGISSKQVVLPKEEQESQSNQHDTVLIKHILPRGRARGCARCHDLGEQSSRPHPGKVHGQGVAQHGREVVGRGWETVRCVQEAATGGRRSCYFGGKLLK